MLRPLVNLDSRGRSESPGLILFALSPGLEDDFNLVQRHACAVDAVKLRASRAQPKVSLSLVSCRHSNGIPALRDSG
jgi:hypothetical protein